jgi:hypothetical protein
MRFDGGMAIVQGSEAWERKGGTPLDRLMAERSVWADTWLKGCGDWQIVAAEDLIAPVG